MQLYFIAHAATICICTQSIGSNESLFRYRNWSVIDANECDIVDFVVVCWLCRQLNSHSRLSNNEYILVNNYIIFFSLYMYGFIYINTTPLLYYTNITNAYYITHLLIFCLKIIMEFDAADCFRFLIFHSVLWRQQKWKKKTKFSNYERRRLIPAFFFPLFVFLSVPYIHKQNYYYSNEHKYYVECPTRKSTWFAVTTIGHVRNEMI